MESGIRPQPLEKCQKINRRRAMFITDSRIHAILSELANFQRNYMQFTGFQEIYREFM
jgi:hypothetical protein